MSPRLPALSLLLLVLFLLVGSTSLRPPAARPAPGATAGARATLARLPLRFEENRGQGPGGTAFLARGSGYMVAVGPAEAVLALGTAGPRPAQLRMRLEGANPRATLRGRRQRAEKVHYMLGGDPKQWRTGVRTFAEVRAEAVYPGIDLVYYGNPSRLEYDFVVAPGADPDRIGLAYAGADTVRLDENGDLVLATPAGELRQQRPVAYQLVDGERVGVPCEYRLSQPSRTEWGNGAMGAPTPPHPHSPILPLVQLAVGAYDQTKPLTIDPVLVYSTFLGGFRDETPVGAAMDADGSLYLVGNTTSTNFPTTSGAYQRRTTPIDLFITHLNAQGTEVLASTYLGGTGDDYAGGIALDGNGGVYVGGAAAGDLPVVGGGLSSEQRGVFIAKLDASLGSVAYLSRFGGDQHTITGVAVNVGGEACIVGVGGSRVVPTTPNALQRSGLGYYEGFVAQINAAGSALLYSSFLSGTDYDHCLGVVYNSRGEICVAGRTNSNNFPVSETSLFAGTNGSNDAFVVVLDPKRSGQQSLVFSSYLGGSQDEWANTIACDSDDQLYLAGQSGSTEMPVTAAAPYKTGSGFLAVIDPRANRLRFCTRLIPDKGYSESSLPVASLAVDARRNVYLCGSSLYAVVPTLNAIQPEHGAGWDGWVMKFNPAGALVYSTYLGSGTATGAGDDYCRVVCVDTAGHAVVAGSTASALFPTTPGVYSRDFSGGTDAFIARLPDLPMPPSGLGVAAANGPLRVNLTWTDNSDNELDFAIDRRTGAGEWQLAFATVPANTTMFTDTRVSGLTSYTYRVQARTAEGGSDPQPAAGLRVTTPSAVPAAPGDLKTTPVSSSQVDLEWQDNSTDETHFAVQRRPGSGGNYAEVGRRDGGSSTGTVRYSDLGLAASTTYLYRIVAVNAVGSSSPSNEAAATTWPQPPTGLQATPLSTTEISLKWGGKTGLETGYKIERRGAGGFVEIQQIDSSTTTYTDRNLTANTSYTYRVRAVTSGSMSEPSNEASATTISLDAPAVPSALGAVAQSQTAIRLTWTDNSDNEQFFSVERRDTDGTFREVGTATAADGTGSRVTLTDTGLAAATTYTYRVRAVRSTGVGSRFSDEASATTLPGPPAAPGLVVTLAGPATAHLAWTDVPGEESYRIERKLGSGGFATLTTVGPNTTGYDDDNLGAGTTYTYRVFAHNAGGDSPPSNEQPVTTREAPPTAPSNLQAFVVSSLEVGLLWQDGSTNETGFVIERREGASGFERVDQVGPDVEQYTDASVSPGTTYVYRVQAINTGGGSAYATSNAVTTPEVDDIRPVAPTNLRAVGLADKIRLTWEYRGTGHTGFLIQRGTVFGTYDTLAVKDADARFHDDSDGLQPNTTYFYQVRALSPGGQSDPARADARLGGGGLIVSPATLDFSAIRRGTARTKPVTIQNLGSASATVQLSRLTGAFTVTNPKGASLKVPGGTTKSVIVQFKPAKKGAASGTLTLRWVEQNKSYTVRLKGKGQ